MKVQLLTATNFTADSGFHQDKAVQDAVERLNLGAAAADQQGFSGLALTLTDLAIVLAAMPDGCAQHVAAALLGQQPTLSTEEGTSGSTKN